MKAAVFHGPKDIRMEEVPDPTPGHGEVVIEVTACGICGSDLEYYTGASPLGTPDGKGPLILGHEFAGRVAALGAGVTHLKEGDRVAVNPVQGDHATDFARSGTPNFDTSNVLGTSVNGGLATYAKSRADSVHLLPDSISDQQGAFTEMLASAVNALESGDIRLGDFVVIYGPGPVGLAQVQLAKMRGATVLLVGTRDYRLEVGKKLGADFVANVADPSSSYFVDNVAEFVADNNSGRLADRALVATTGLRACNEAIVVTGEGAVVVYMGLAGPDDHVQLPMLTSLVAAKTIKFAWLYPHQWPKTLNLLAANAIDTSSIITHSLPLASVADAIMLLETRDENVIKVVLEP